MNHEFFNDTVWENAWKEDELTSTDIMRRSGIDPFRAFDHRAASFDEEVFSDEGRGRAKRIMSWLYDQGVSFKGMSVLDIGAASGGFAIPFAEMGAEVTAVEPSIPLAALMRERAARLTNGTVNIVSEPFETIDIQAKGWEKAFDFVFVSMCPVLHDWDSVGRIMSCAREYCYMSTSVGRKEHSVFDEIWPLVSDQPQKSERMEMLYLLQLLFLKGYAYQSLVTREMNTTVRSKTAVFEEVIEMLKHAGLSGDRVSRTVSRYLDENVPSDQVTIRQGGRFGKVLVRLKSQNMFSRDNL